MFIKLLEEVTKESLYRLNPRLLFLPSLDNANYSNHIFCAKEIHYTPDLLVIDFDLSENSGKCQRSLLFVACNLCVRNSKTFIYMENVHDFSK